MNGTETVIMFTPQQLWAAILAICAGISCIAGAAVWIFKGVKAMKAPNQKQDERLASIEARLAKHDEFFASDKRRLESLEEGNRVSMRALLALLAHGIDGNEIETMKKSKEELQKFLIDR